MIQRHKSVTEKHNVTLVSSDQIQFIPSSPSFAEQNATSYYTKIRTGFLFLGSNPGHFSLQIQQMRCCEKQLKVFRNRVTNSNRYDVIRVCPYCILYSVGGTIWSLKIDWLSQKISIQSGLELRSVERNNVLFSQETYVFRFCVGFPHTLHVRTGDISLLLGPVRAPSYKTR